VRWLGAHEGALTAAASEIAHGYAEILALESMKQLSSVDREIARERIAAAVRRVAGWHPGHGPVAVLLDPEGDRPVPLMLAELCLRAQGYQIRWAREPDAGALNVIAAPLYQLDTRALAERVLALRAVRIAPVVVRTDFSALGSAAARAAA
jgi:hypothetical protein